MRFPTPDPEAVRERDEIIRNAEAAYRRREITADELEWIRRYTAKELVTVREDLE